MSHFDEVEGGRGEGVARRDFKRGDKLIIHFGGRDVPAVATSDVLPDGLILVAYSSAVARVPASAVRHAS